MVSYADVSRESIRLLAEIATVTPHALVITSALVLCFVFSAILAHAVLRQRAAAADLAWFYDSGSFNIPVSQRSALRAFGSLLKRRVSPPSARRSTSSSPAEDRRHGVAGRTPAAQWAAPATGVLGTAARKCAANQSADGE